MPTPAPQPAAPSAPLTVATDANTVTYVRLQNTQAKEQDNVAVTFGQVFAVGHLAAGQTVTGKLGDGTAVPLQVDVKARHADGSVRHAIISAKVASLGAEVVDAFYVVDAQGKPLTDPALIAAVESALLAAVG